jgi:replication protein O
MASNRDGKPPFRGFRSPTYTQVPDELFDELLPELSGAELKVLLYIIRRTFGFKRERDSISLSQMLHGIHGRDGEPLDRGTGVSKPTLLQALRSLETRGIIATERRRSAEKGDEPTVYTLRFAPDEGGQKSIRPLDKKVDQGGGQESSPPAWSKNLTTQETGKQETDFDHSNFERSPDQTTTTKGRRTDLGGGPARRDHAANAPTEPSDRVPLMPLGEILQLRQQAAASIGVGSAHHPAAGDRTDPAPPGRKGRPPGSGEEREELAAYLGDFARELGDAAPLSATITRVLALFQAAQLPAEQWGGVLYQARSITQERTAQIRTLAAGGETGLRRKNKMPYFLAVLEDLLGLSANPPRNRT